MLDKKLIKAEKLYKSLQDNFVKKGELKDNEIEFLRALRLTAIANDQIFLLAQMIQKQKNFLKAVREFYGTRC